MIAHLFEPQNVPFAVALGVMLLIAAMEGVGLLFGVALSGLIDSLLPDFDMPDIDVDVDADFDGPELDTFEAGAGGPFTQFLSWLCVGRVPMLILLVAMLTAFGLIGFAMQGAMFRFTGSYLPALFAVVPAFALALPATRMLGLGLARIMPKEETDAVSVEHFIGRVAVVTTGTAQRGLPAQAKLRDRHGHTHYLQVEPDIDGDSFPTGSEVLIVSQDGGIFRVIGNTYETLSRRRGYRKPKTF